ncbi:uncharacterized protein [Paramisgurnus dabryanus]|uniref:uncharacterized protein n=1 Tax=Paramisgurnus dabryanus TaxID=90735 RepID=UPI0031F45012
MDRSESTSVSIDSCAMILRVVQADRARKIKLDARPSSVNALIQTLKEQLQLDLEFRLQYEDPEFDNQLTYLDDISDLPQKAVVHILPVESVIFTTSTVILSDVSNPERNKIWSRDDFPIPQFSYDVELRLRQGNADFEKNGKSLKLTRDQKHDILEKLGSALYDFKAYPDDREVGKVAEALIKKHPCLKEPGSDTGWNGWKTSIKFKMGNLRSKMRKIGCLEVAVNAGKRSQTHPENELSHSKIKKPRRSEVNYLPNFPVGEDEASLETIRQEIALEVEKREINLCVIHKKMEKTFALRRQTIVNTSPSVKDFLHLWPALRVTSEIKNFN